VAAFTMLRVNVKWRKGTKHMFMQLCSPILLVTDPTIHSFFLEDPTIHVVSHVTAFLSFNVNLMLKC